MEDNNLIKKADREHKYLEGEERIRRLAELKRRTSLEINSAKVAGFMDGIEEGKKQGIEEGIKKGEEKGKKIGDMEEILRMAKAMLDKNISINDISEITNLPIKEIEKLV